MHGLCRQHRIWSTTTRKGPIGKSRSGPAGLDNLVRRDFTADRPYAVWVTEITKHPAAEGKLYCRAMHDVFSNRIVRYAIDDRMTAQLAVVALSFAVARRQPSGAVVDHSDRGSHVPLSSVP